MEDRGAIETSFLEGASDQWVQFAIAGPLNNLINVHATGATSHFEPALAARKDTKNGFRVRSEDAANFQALLSSKNKTEEETKASAAQSSLPCKQNDKDRSPSVSDISFSSSEDSLTSSFPTCPRKEPISFFCGRGICQRTERVRHRSSTDASRDTRPRGIDQALFR